ncbi:hypothetical protein [Bradyrhizobium jicamae]|uniref:hypothetical protein n=1 Tax=Bradyrhizobium jicamae TaxID=280332 RepID=UPI001BA9923F|nr:hypothetical protein [Bradyrhizobium jicamae]MBR0934853.1 hypothetical protein [Bradyrhizobium jicamae]
MDTYRIGISIVLSNTPLAALQVIASRLLGLHGHVGRINSGFQSWKTSLDLVAAVGLAGVLAGIEKVTQATKDYQSELIKLERIGGSMQKAVLGGDVSRQAFGIAQRVPMKVEDLMKIPGLTYSILRGDMGEVNQTWEPLAKFGYVLSSGGHRGGEDVTKDVAAALRAGELTGRITDTEGKIDLKKLNDWLDTVARITATTHGTVNGQTLLGMAQQGGFTMRNLSPEGMQQMAIAAQVMGGQRAGTAYMSLWQQMGAGTMFTRTAEGLEKLGFLTDKDWHTDHGRVILEDSGKKKLSSLIAQDPMIFAQEVKKRMDERGITDPDDRTTMLMSMLNRQTTQRFMGEMFSNMQQQLAERGIMMQGMGAGESFDLLKNKDIATNLEAVSNAWHNLLVAVGSSHSTEIVSTLKGITDFINNITSAFRDSDKLRFGGEGDLDPKLDPWANIWSKLSGQMDRGADDFSAWQQRLINDALAHLKDTLKDAFTSAVSSVTDWASAQWRALASSLDGIKTTLTNFFDGLIGAAQRIADFVNKWGGRLGWMFGFGGEKVPGLEDHALKHKSSLDGLWPSGGEVLRPVPVMFNPSTNQPRHEQNSFSLNIDGQTLAQTMIDKICEMTTYPTGAPTPDGMGQWFAGDHNYTDT